MKWQPADSYVVQEFKSIQIIPHDSPDLEYFVLLGNFVALSFDFE